MKEATGELNMSVVVISSVAILVAFFYTVLWPMLDDNQKSQMNCSKAVCEKKADRNGMVKCKYKDKDGSSHDITCKFKG